MSAPITHASPPRLLTPVAGKIQNEGAAFVPLSPHKGVRNAVIIYEAIKNLPDHNLVRGDFDKRSRPFIYFPERPPKQVGRGPVDAVAARNARHDRAEFASFMKSIVEATYKAAPVKSPQLRAAFDLRCSTLRVTEECRDFTVGDIRAPLRSIAKSYYRQELKKITSPHRTQPPIDAALQTRRFKQFLDMKSSMVLQLCDALSLGVDSDDADVTALMAIQEMKQMLARYRVLRNTENLSFAEFLLQHPIPRGACTFARLWMALDGPDRSGRKLFCTESWALEMDRVCPAIVKEYRAAKRLKHRGGSSEEWSGDRSSSAGSETESAASRSTGREAPRYRASTRRRVSGTTAPNISARDADALVSRFTRQSSLPAMPRRSSEASRQDASGGSNPDVAFLDSQPQISTVIYYSAIEDSVLLPETASPPAPAPVAAKAVAVAASTPAEERSREPDESNTADLFSQEDQ